MKIRCLVENYGFILSSPTYIPYTLAGFQSRNFGSMKKTIIIIATFFILHNLNAQTYIYYSAVEMPAFLNNNYYGQFDTKSLAEDLADLLQQATGKQFFIKAYEHKETKGIFLLLDSVGKYNSNENGTLESDGNSFVRIKGRYTTGISYAMYSWLQQLGFNFYLPGKEWSVIPRLNTVFSKHILKTSFAPYFKLRIFSPSGSMFPVKGLDEEGRNIKEWRLWYRRNRMGCDYIRIDGHIGELFNIVHKKEIEADPNILAPVDGKRQYIVGGKLDPTNKKGVTLFSDWITNEFKKEQDQWPKFLPLKKYYTVDAGDGLGYCHTAECEQQFKTVSDQVFSIANETARKIKSINPVAGVSSLAYTERADTPSIQLEPNIHVMVVPTAFQSVGTAAELMKRWAKKTSNISQYDFINIGVWSYDMPFFNLDKYFNYLNFLKSLKIEGMGLETSWSKFGSGIQQYFILKFLCDPYQSIDKVLDEFCKNNFGNAATQIKALLKEWYFSSVHLYTNFDKPTFYADELGRFVQYIISAEKAPGLNDQILKRINELKAYTVYLCKYYELNTDLENKQAFTDNPLLKIKKTEELLTYTWQLYDSKIFHNTQLNDMLKKGLDEKQKAQWDYYKSNHFASLNTNTALLIATEFEKVKKKYLLQAASNYSIDDSFLSANVKYSADSICISTIDETAFGNFIYPVEFYCAVPGPLKIAYQTGRSENKNDEKKKIAVISVESNDYHYIKTDFLFKENSTGEVIYQLPVKGHYRLYLSQYNATHIKYVIYPGNTLFYHNKKSILMNGLKLQDDETINAYSNKYLAIYVPPADSLYFSNYYTGTPNTSHLYTASGGNIPVHTNLLYNSAPLPKKRENNFIFYENSTYRWPPVLKNTAPYYFFLKYPLK